MKQLKILNGIHKSFENCDVVYMANDGDPGKKISYPIYIGVVKSENLFLLSFGPDMAPFELTQDNLFYMLDAMQATTAAIYNDEMGLNEKDFREKFKSVRDKANSLSIGHSGGTKPMMSTEELANFLKSEKGEDVVGASEEINELIDKVKIAGNKLRKEDLEDSVKESIMQEIEDVRSLVDKMPEAEKNAFYKQMAKRTESVLDEKVADLEKELLGDIEIEEEPDFSYAYFEGVFIKKGIQALKEELAKIPKEDRKAIIEKITKEHSN